MTKKELFRLAMPYGYWVEDDGTKVVFNRNFRFILAMDPLQNKPCTSEAVNGLHYLYDDYSAPWINLRNEKAYFRLYNKTFGDV